MRLSFLYVPLVNHSTQRKVDLFAKKGVVVVDGILPLYKPKGMTSHDCVAKVRKLLRTKKVGHTGTLDPDVDGVLLLCIGRATKLVQYLTNDTKAYEAEITIGVATSTEDASGDIIAKKQLERKIDRKEIVDVLTSFCGKINQIPPMYSAVKVNGRRLYEYAREGIEVERPSRTVEIYNLSLIDQSFTYINHHHPSFRVSVTCSKGTYIRTLAVDIGEKLGYPAHMSNLIRTEAGTFSLDDCLTFEKINEKIHHNQLKLMSIESALADFKKHIVNPEEKQKVLNGTILRQPVNLESSEKLAIFDDRGYCLAIYQKHPRKEGLIKPDKVLFTSSDVCSKR